MLHIYIYKSNDLYVIYYTSSVPLIFPDFIPTNAQINKNIHFEK